MSQQPLNRVMAVLAACSAAGAALAQVPFALDVTLATNVQNRYVTSVLPLPNGTVIISGAFKFPGDLYERTGALLNSDGTRNTSFPEVAQMGGKLMPWLGRIYSGNGNIVRRHLLNGTLDIDFISLNTGPYFSSLQGGDYHVFPDGRVVLSGVHMLSDTVRGFTGAHRLVWFSNQGYLDTTRIHRKGNGVINRFVELPTGRFIASGLSTQFAGRPVDRIFRFEADGSVDTTYRTFINWGEARDFVPLSNGSVYAGGRYVHASAPQDTIYVARFLPDGTLDPAFNRPHLGLGALPDPGWGFGPDVFGLDTLPDGRLAVTGYFQYVNGQERRGIFLLDGDGNLLDDFGGCGIFPYVYNPTPSLTINYGHLYGITRYDATHYLVYGAYHGYGDGTTTDMQQRMVSRLHVGDFTTGVSSATAGPSFALYPNPATGSATLQLEQVPPDAQVLLRDALGREVQTQRVSGHYTTLTLERSGVYVVELWSGGQRVRAQRLVVE